MRCIETRKAALAWTCENQTAEATGFSRTSTSYWIPDSILAIQETIDDDLFLSRRVDRWRSD